MSEARARKLADRIKVIVAEAVEMRVKDPRLGFVTFTDARVTNDLRDATLFYTVYGDDKMRDGTAAALESAKGVLRSEVGRSISARHTPSLTFVADAIPENARLIDELLDRAAASDAELNQRAVGAEYAAGPDAYRVPRVEAIDGDEDSDEDSDDDSDDKE